MTSMTFTTAVDRVNERAAQVDWRRVGLVALIALPFLLFAAARCVVRAAGWLGARVWAAGMVGWEAAGPRREAG